MKRTKLLIVHSALQIGGAEEVTVHLCNKIDRSRFDVTVCYLAERGVIGDKIARQGTDVIGVASSHTRKTDYLTALKLRSVIVKNNYDIVHSHDIHSLIDCSICRLTLSRLKCVHTFHYGNYPHRETARRRREGLFWRIPDHLVSVADRQREGIRALYNIPEKRITTVWNGIDVLPQPTTFPIIERSRSQGRVIIGCINSLIEQKGMFDMIEVAAELKNRVPNTFAFLVAGDGPLRQELQEMVVARQLENDIHFLGWVVDASSTFLPNLDVFFQPSLWEAMSIVLLEAMANAKAIAASAVGETPTVLVNDQCGKIVRPGDREHMVAVLEELITDSNLRRRLGGNAKERHSRLFNARAMAERYEQIYLSVLT